MKPAARPRSAEEIAALPEGPVFDSVEIVLTAEDRARGYVEYQGRRINIVVSCSKVVIPIAPDVIATFAGPDDILGHVDAAGVAWTLGCYANGTWFKHRK